MTPGRVKENSWIDHYDEGRCRHQPARHAIQDESAAVAHGAMLSHGHRRVVRERVWEACIIFILADKLSRFR